MRLMHAQGPARSPDAGSVEAYAARHLDLLSAIERAVAGTAADAEYLHAVEHDLRSFDEWLQQHPPAAPIDPTGKSVEKFKAIGAAIERMHSAAGRSVVSARDDHELLPDDGVVEGFEQLADACADAFDALQALVERVETFDALSTASPAAATYHSPAQLVDDILSGR